MADWTPMSEDELAEIEAREKAATPGPWFYEPRYGTINDGPSTEDDHLLCGCCWHDNDDPDFIFAAHARADVPRLVAELRHYREALREAREERDAFGAGIDAVNALELSGPSSIGPLHGAGIADGFRHAKHVMKVAIETETAAAKSRPEAEPRG